MHCGRRQKVLAVDYGQSCPRTDCRPIKKWPGYPRACFVDGDSQQAHLSSALDQRRISVKTSALQAFMSALCIAGMRQRRYGAKPRWIGGTFNSVRSSDWLLSVAMLLSVSL